MEQVAGGVGRISGRVSKRKRRDWEEDERGSVVKKEGLGG